MPTIAPEQAEALFKALGTSDFRLVAGGNALMTNCPFSKFTHRSGGDSSPSFRFDLRDGGYKCYSCNKRGRAPEGIPLELAQLDRASASRYYSLVADWEKLTAFEARIDHAISGLQAGAYGADSGKVVRFPESYLDPFAPALEVPRAVDYLCGARGISREAVKFLGLVYDRWQDIVAMPVRDSRGVLYGLHGRFVEPQGKLKHFAYGYKDHRNTHVWLNEQNIDFDKPVVTCEGFIDLAKIWDAYPNVMGSMTCNVTVGRARVLRAASQIVTMYDVGTGGDSARAYYRREFPSSIDVTPRGYSDPGEMPTAAITEQLPYMLTK